ncbi:UNVERIFIED_CONTAM: hypothetical protein K2H54_001235 [Gekko kuhli]
MLNWKHRRCSLSETADGKQQKIDKFVSNTQFGAVHLSNRYAVLDSQILLGEEEQNALAETNVQQHCCQQLPTIIMELFSKEAILTSHSLAILFDKINDIDAKDGSGLWTEDWIILQDNCLFKCEGDPNPHTNTRDEYLEAEGPHRQKPTNCQKGATHEIELDLRSHQVISMPSGAPTNVKSLAFELWEAEVDRVRAQQSQLILMDGMPMETEGNLILPTSLENGEQLPHSITKRRPDTLIQQGAEGVPLVPLHQEGMLDNSIEDTLFTIFEDLTPQKQHAVTEQLEHTKNRLLAWKVLELSGQQVTREDVVVDSNSYPSMQMPLVPQPLSLVDVELATEQSGSGTSAVIVDSPQMLKNGSVFFDRNRVLNQITESD